jgi:PAS domain S-box-containing protein
MDNKKIFIAASDAQIVYNLKDSLCGLGYDVVGTVKNKALFLENATKWKFDLIIIDIELNEIENGFDIANELKDFGNPPIIFLFNRLNPKTVEQAKQYDAYAFLSKPINEDELFAAVEMTLYKHSRHTAISDKEERYRLVSSITSDIRFSLSVLSNDQVILDWVTPSFQTHLGYSLEQIIKKQSILDFARKNTYQPDLIKLIPLLERLKEGFEINHEIIFYKRNGEERWFNFHLIPKLNSKNQIIKIYGAAQDITDRKKIEISISELNNELEMRVQERTAQLEVAVENLRNEIAERVATEEKLKESEERYKQLFEAESDAIFLIENHTGKILETNSAAETMYGYSRNELLKMKNNDLSYEPEQTINVTKTSPIAVNSVVTIPLRFHRKKDGTIFPVEITGRFFIHQGVPVHIAAIRDITERRKSEQALRENKEQLNFALNAVNDGIWDWRPLENFLYWSPSYLSMLGYSQNEFIPSVDTWKSLLHPEDQPRAEEYLVKCIRNETDDFQVESRFKTKAGAWKWILIRGRVIQRNDKNEIIRMLGVHSDINERKIAEEKLIEQNYLIEQMLETIPDVIYFKDKESRFLILSNSYLNRFGVKSKDDLIGKTDFDLYTTEHAQDAFNDEQTILQTGNSIISKEEKEIWLNGEEHWVLTTKMPWRNAQGKIMGTFGISREITEKKKVELDLIHALKQWQTTFNSVSDIVWILGKDYKIVRSNNSTVTILGKNPDEVIGKECWAAICDEAGSMPDCPIGRMKISLKRETLIIKIADKLLSITADPILDENNNLLGAVQTIADVTLTYAAEEKIRSNEIRLRTVVSNSPGIISTLDENGVFTLSEGKSLHRLGLSSEKVVGKSIYEIYRDFPALLNALKRVYSGEVVSELIALGDLYFDTTFESIKNAQGKIELVIIVAHDVTEQKLAQEAVLQNETLLKDAQKIANVGHYVFDVRSGFWTNSEQLDIILGIDSSFTKDINGWSLLIHPDDVEMMLTHLTKEVLVDHKNFDKEYKIIRYSDKQQRWVHGIGQLRFNADGTVLQMFGTIQDITDRKEAETQLNRAQFSIDKANDAIYWINVNGDFEYVNESSCNHLGYSKDELLKMKIFDIDSRATVESWKQWFDNMRSLKTFQLESLLSTRARSILPIEISVNYMLFDGKELLACFVRDISERKIAERAAKESEERYKLIAENSADVIWILDIHQERFTYVSPSVLKLRGLTFEEVIAQPMKDALTPQSYDLVQKLLKKSIENYYRSDRTSTTVTTEIDQFHKDGRIIPTEVVTTMIPNEQGTITHILGVSRDITDRKKAEAQLQESEERYRLLVEHSPYAIAVHQNGKLVYVNQQTVKLQGAKAASELIGLDALQMLHPDSRALAAKRIQEAATTGEVQPIAEGKVIKFDGTVIDCEITSVPITLNGALAHQVLLRDITEIKQANDQLKKLSRVVEESPAAILITDEKGIIEYVNPKFTDITGYTFSEAVGNSPRMLKSGEQSQEIYQYLWNTLNSGNEWRGEFHNKKKNGELYWEYDYITPIKNSLGEIKNFVAIKEDITERKRLLQDIVKSKEEAEEANKVKSSLLANMSHEFRTPLNGILGFAQLLKDELKEEDHVMMLSKIHSSGKRLMNTLNAILTLTELESEDHMIQFTELDLAFFCQEMRIFFETAALSKNIKISVDLETNYLSVITDENLLTKIVSNIIDNAIKYTPSGQIKIRLTTDISPDNKNFAVLSVIDTGIGIRKDDQAIIFKEFRQLSEGFRRDFEGLGLGLTIAKRMAKLINSDIIVNSIYGVGSTFSVIIPMSHQEIQSLNEQIDSSTTEVIPEKVKALHSDQLKILLVEDNPLNVEVVQRFLSKTGKVTAARDGLTAIKYATENDFDLLLIDINLGHGIDGSEVLRQLRKLEKYKHTPSIALTGYASETNKREFLGQGFTSYLAKPFEKKVLLKVISKLVQ